MNIKSKNPFYHLAYWIFVILVLTLVFGFSWGNNTAAFFFVCMLLPIVLGTSYFFNYVLVPKFYLTKKYAKFAFYTFCMAVISVYLEMIVLVISYVYLVNLSYQNLSPNATQIVLLAVILYLLVFIGSFLLMVKQIKENRQVIQQLLEEKDNGDLRMYSEKSNDSLIRTVESFRDRRPGQPRLPASHYPA